MKIRAKFLVVIGLVITLLGIAALSGVLLSTSLLEREITGKYLAVSAYAMEKVHRLFSRRSEEMRVLANEPVLRSRDSTPAMISALLASYKKHHRSSYAPYASVAFYSLDRRCIADTEGEGRGARQDMAGFWQKIDGGEESFIDISFPASPGQAVFNLVNLVRDEQGAPRGVVVSRIGVEGLQAIVQRPLRLLKLSMPPNIDLLDRNGLILYSTRNKGGMLKEIWPAFDKLHDSLATGKQSWTRLYTDEDRGNAEDILIFVREESDSNFRGNDWILTISIPRGFALAPMIALRNQLIIITIIIGLVSAIIAILLSRTITRPLVRLSKAASEVGGGNLGIAVKVSSGDEVGALAGTFNDMVKKLDELNRELQRAATVDKLTGALNRGRIDQLLQLEMERSRRYHTPLALIMLDLDHFKRINDTYGHLEGDQVLKAVVASIRQNLRSADALGRWGGEEFLVILPQTGLAQAAVAAEKVRHCVEKRAPDHVCCATVSCGVAVLREGDSEDSFLKRADVALYAAKHRGRNRVVSETEA